MTLNKSEKALVLNFGYNENDIQIIEKAKFEFRDMNGNSLTLKQAKEILTTEDFLSGVSRSVFHHSASRIGSKNSVKIICLNWNNIKI